MVELPRFILGLDAGYKSGIALLDLMFETCDGVEVTWDKFGYEIERYVRWYRPTIVAEKFVINAATVKNTQAPWSLKANGAAECYARQYGCTYVERAQSAAKRFATNEKLERLGWRIPGKGHLADAQRQALLYVVEHGWWHALLD